MKEFDFGYFGIGDEGYAQYRTTFDRIFGTDGSDAGETSCDDYPEEDTDEEDF